MGASCSDGLDSPQVDGNEVAHEFLPCVVRVDLADAPYWSRKTSIGSTRPARTAGIAHARANFSSGVISGFSLCTIVASDA